MLYGRVVCCWAGLGRESVSECLCVCLIFRQALEVKNCGCVCAVAGPPLFYFHGSPFSFLMFTLFSNKINCLCAHITSIERVVPRTSRSTPLSGLSISHKYIYESCTRCSLRQTEFGVLPWPSVWKWADLIRRPAGESRAFFIRVNWPFSTWWKNGEIALRGATG